VREAGGSGGVDGLERLDAGSREDPHAVVGVEVAVDAADFEAEDAFQYDPSVMDDGHVEAALAS
jgi:hypothetical protein